MKKISQGTIGGLLLPVPPISEQQRISEFLDAETAKIDALVAEQRRLMELLKEKRQAVISHAVTKGLDSDAPTRPSGIESLGDVPAHWAVSAVRRVVARIEQGWSPECYGRPAEVGEWGVLKTGCVNRGVFVEEENKALPETLVPIAEYEVRAGNVLMSRASGSPELVGSTAFVESVRPHLLLSDKTFRIHPEPIIASRFFVNAFNSRLLRDQIERAISGAEGLANNLPQSALLTFRICVPPLSEQWEIVAYIAGESKKIDDLYAEAQRAIDLLQERRSALISAAVTGQIDVRNLAQSEAA
jgi:type I restriction enzyme S subunit